MSMMVESESEGEGESESESEGDSESEGEREKRALLHVGGRHRKQGQLRMRSSGDLSFLVEYKERTGPKSDE